MDEIRQVELLGNYWGTLLILDACRYDVFKEVAGELDLKGELQCADSGVLGTSSWYYKNWRGQPGQTNITAVVANPWGLRYPLKFEQVIKAWDSGMNCAKVDPDRTMDFYRKFASGKRAMVHFVPPHQPFLGEKGKAVYEKLGINMEQREGTKWDWENNKKFTALTQVQKLLSTYGRSGHWGEVKDAYKENVNFIVTKIKKWLPEFLPPVVITADHGEVVGEGGKDEKGGYGHCHNQPNVRMIQRLVPWFVFSEDNEIMQRLKSLGYV